MQYTIEDLIQRYPVLASTKDQIEAAYAILKACYQNGGKLLVCGNGGSCADADHIVGELMKGFKKKRTMPQSKASNLLDQKDGRLLCDELQEGLPAIGLHNHAGLNTAFANDVPHGAELVYAQQVNVLGKPGDVFLGISTSGNARNVSLGAQCAKALGLKVLGLTGRSGGELKQIADMTIAVDETETFKVQELHLPIYHYLCLRLEEELF